MDVSTVVFAFLSAVIMGTIGVFSKMTGLPSEIITFFRLFLGALFMLIFLAVTGNIKLIRRRPAIPVLESGIFLAGFIIFYVQAMNFTSMANATMLVYLAPLVASVVSHFIMNEYLTSTALGLIVLALFGFCMVMEFNIGLSGNSNEVVGICFGLLALSAYAGFILVNRMIREEVHVYSRAFNQLLTGGCVMIPFIIYSIQGVSVSLFLWLIGVGFFSGYLALLRILNQLQLSFLVGQFLMRH